MKTNVMFNSINSILKLPCHNYSSIFVGKRTLVLLNSLRSVLTHPICKSRKLSI